ncbi:MAG: hypothetical protein C0480_01120 [Bradyrhizobium sp.]|nr:hypothetical protein [Bradyrhizobium sp.]
MLRTSSQRLLRLIVERVESNGGPVAIWHDEFPGSRTVINPGLRELIALGFIVQRKLVKQSRFALSDEWRNIGTKREALLTSVNARLPQTHRKWKPQPNDVHA